MLAFKGLLYPDDWKAKWIEPKQEPVALDLRTDRPGDNSDEADMESGNVEPKQRKEIDEAKMSPCQMVRKAFQVSEKVRCARVYATAHGAYRLVLNGKRGGDYELASEVAPYHNYLRSCWTERARAITPRCLLIMAFVIFTFPATRARSGQRARRRG